MTEAPAPLKTHRERLHLSQVELAAKAGVSESTIWLIEHRGRRPRSQNRRAIAEALGLDPNAVVEFVRRPDGEHGDGHDEDDEERHEADTPRS